MGIEARRVNEEVRIAQVAEDWGLELLPRGGHNYELLCPNPQHQDTRVGSCTITDNGAAKNFFHCFACDAGGGPIDLVMLVDKVDFQTAIKKIAARYGLTESDVEKAPVKAWKGLSQEEYAHFGLGNPIVEVLVAIDEDGKPVHRHVPIRLRDLATADPEAHDDMLVGKFYERSVLGALSFLGEMDDGHLIWQGIHYTEAWLDAVVTALREDLALLQKGLMKRKRYAHLFREPLKRAS